MNDQQLFSKEAGRDVMSDQRPWQRQALGHVERLAIQQGFRRRHPSRLLASYASQTFNGPNPRTKWEDAMRRSEDLTQIPEYYRRANESQLSNQVGLIETANKNFMKSRSRIQITTPVGV